MVETGNAGIAGMERGGWLLGHFMPPESPLHSRDVEVKWARHVAGERRTEWAGASGGPTLSILVSGRFVVEFENREAILHREGDFAFWDGTERHCWRCEEDSVVVSVRWPSRP